MSTTDDGGPDVAQLEARIDALEEQYSDETVSDSNGNRISLGGLLNSGLSRRQALKTMALVVSGATLTGAMTQSVAAQNAITGIDQLGEQDDRIGTIYAQDIDTDTFTQSTEAIDVDSVTTGELNNVTVVNPDTDDIGAELNQLDSNLDHGDVVYIPPGEYPLSTAYDNSTALNIIGEWRRSHRYFTGGTTIVRQTDTPFIDGGTEGFSLSGVRFEGNDEYEGSNDYSSTAITIQGPTYINMAQGWSLGGDFIHLDDVEGTNLNGCRALIDGRNIEGDLLKLTSDTPSSPDVNGIYVEIITASRVHGYVVNEQAGISNTFDVPIVEDIGPSSDGNVFYVGGEHSKYNAPNVEQTGTVFEFAGDNNTVGFQNTFNISGLHNDSGDNRVINWGMDEASDMFIERTGGPDRIDGQPSESELYAGQFSGSTPDDRLDSAISFADTGDTVQLENVEYTSDRSITTSLKIVGTDGSGSAGSKINAEWTFDSTVKLQDIARGGSSAAIVVNSTECVVTNCYFFASDSITVNADLFRFIGNQGATVTFGSDTSGGIVDSCTNTSVTDNGSNTEGTIG